MNIEKINLNSMPSSKWSGGKTYELVIYPNNSSYKERNFYARISTAEVLCNKTEFTYLPGIKRYLSPLNTQFLLKHGNGDEFVLNEKNIDVFNGNDLTECYGTGNDFNLMLQDCKGSMFIADIYEISSKIETSILYFYEDTTMYTKNLNYFFNGNTFVKINNINTDITLKFSNNILIAEIMKKVEE